MKTLLILWDPENPLVPVAPVVEALQALPDVQVRTLTFSDCGHRTLPNQAFKLQGQPPGTNLDAILWIEGGALPANLDEFSCPKACWLLNTHCDPGLLDLKAMFDLSFCALLRDCADDQAIWLPLSTSERLPLSAPVGLSILLDDPRPPDHSEIEAVLRDTFTAGETASHSVVVALGNGGRAHPLLVDCLRSGAAVIVDPETDLRGIAQIGEHLDVFPSRDGIGDFIRTVLKDSGRLGRLASRGPAIVEHLHLPAMRAARIREGLFPRREILSGKDHHSRVSVLVTCFRYLRRFRICLESLARQILPAGTIEIVVADPASPDGLSEELRMFAQRHPELRVVHLPIDGRYHRNRGVGINRAFEASKGEVVIGIDGDIVFPPTLVGLLEKQVLNSPDRVFGVKRSFVGREDTDRILKGDLDPFSEFEKLSQSEGDGEEKPFVGVLGYCQAVHRKAFSRARYPEEFDTVNQSDIVFVERLAKEAKVTAKFLPDQTVLHLWHPRNWMGTDQWL